MKVVREPLTGTDIERLTVADPEGSEKHIGEVAGYFCPHCYQSDETLEQIWHEANCQHAGEHGRAHYEDVEPVVDGSPELDPGHEFRVIRAAETDDPHGIHVGEVIAFRCEDCGNADETLFEIIHDERCGIAKERLLNAGQ